MQNKHVEVLCVACLDEGSNPSNSTNATDNQLATTATPIFTPIFIKWVFFIPYDKMSKTVGDS